MQTRTVMMAIVSLVSAQESATAPAITSHIPRQQVDSNVISEIGYSKRRHWLELKFVSGATYRYVDVPPSVYRDLMAADSKVSYYVRYMRNNYRALRVRPRVNDKAPH
jgi:hypothetical protein